MDIAKVAEVVRKYSEDIIIAVDNTFLSAYFQVRVNAYLKSKSVFELYERHELLETTDPGS